MNLTKSVATWSMKREKKSRKLALMKKIQAIVIIRPTNNRIRSIVMPCKKSSTKAVKEKRHKY